MNRNGSFQQLEYQILSDGFVLEFCRTLLLKHPGNAISAAIMLNGLAAIISAVRPDDQFEYQLIYYIIHGLLNGKK